MGVDEEEPRDIDGKTGKDLFLELFRLLPSAHVEDYHWNGKWQDEDIILDYDLLQAHRREAGAEDPPSLEELKDEMPLMPGERPAFSPVLARPAVTPVAPGAAKALSVVKPAATPKVAGLKPQPPASAPTSAMVAAAGGAKPGTGPVGAAGGPSAELRQIALFIAKWKLEATKTKLLLARLTPPRRRWVMQKFTSAGGASSPTAQLEAYIAQCERNNAWSGAVETSSASASVGAAPKPMSGLKRPLTPSPGTVALAVKKPKLGATSYGVAPFRPAVAPTYTRSTPAWLANSTIKPVGVAAARPLMPARATYGGGMAAARPGGISPLVTQRLGAVRPQTPKYGVATIKPMAPKLGGAKPAGVARFAAPKPAAAKPKPASKPGSLIANLLKM